MMRLIFLLGMLLSLTALAFGDDAPAPPPATQTTPAPPPATPPAAPTPKERVATILTSVKAGDDAACDTAENTLVGEGDTLADAVRETWRATREALGKTPDDATLRAQAEVLDAARLRLAWGWQPTKAVTDWLGRLKNADDSAFEVTVRPHRVADDAVEAVFAEQCFYIVRFPATQTLPAPLQATNVFIVGKTGTVKLVAGTDDLEALFRTKPAAVPQDNDAPVKQIVRAWLRLSQEFSQDGTRRFLIADDSIKADYHESTVGGMDGWRAGGQLTADPKTGLDGIIAVSMVFDGGGQLKVLTETRDLHPAAPPAPPAPAPATETPATPPAPAPDATKPDAPKADAPK